MKTPTQPPLASRSRLETADKKHTHLVLENVVARRDEVSEKAAGLIVRRRVSASLGLFIGDSVDWLSFFR